VRLYVARPPAPPLAKFAEYLWASQGAPSHAYERVVPTGTVELVVNLRDDVMRICDADGRYQSGSGIAVAGAYRRPFIIETHESASAIGVHFKPGCAGVVLGVPPGELVDRHVDLESLWGRRATELRERLCTAPTTDERFAILEAELASRLHERRIHPVVMYAVNVLRQPQARVGDIAVSTQLSPRRLIQLFTAAVGLTPKRFGRVARFHCATRLARGSALDWTRIAHASGYYDQSHLIRDFRELAEVAPSDLLRVALHEQEHHQLAILDR
jgi:AraC-like DNA-binding protein